VHLWTTGYVHPLDSRSANVAIAVLALAMRARYVWDYDISEQEFDALLAGSR
jgi:hypothetical protein